MSFKKLIFPLICFVIFLSYPSLNLFGQCLEDFPLGSTDWTVPDGVRAISFVASGGAGGAGGAGGSSDNGAFLGGPGGQGGNGATIIGDQIAVNPGDVLRIIVGSAGTAGNNGGDGGVDAGGDGGDGGSGGNVTAIINLTTNSVLVVAPGGGGGAGGGGGGTQETGATGVNGFAGSIFSTSIPPNTNLVPGLGARPGVQAINLTRGNSGVTAASGSGISIAIETIDGFAAPGGADGAGGDGGSGGAGGGAGFTPPSFGPGGNLGAGGGGFSGVGGRQGLNAFLMGANLLENIPGAITSNRGDGFVEITFDDGSCPDLSEEIPALPMVYLVSFGMGLLFMSILVFQRLSVTKP